MASPPSLATVVRILLFVGGAALFGLLLFQIGPAALTTALSGLSWRIVIILVFPFVLVTIFDTLGWRYAFRWDRAPLRTLLWARLAGEAFNATTPTASVGGEAIKAWLLRPQVPLTESLPSVVIAKTTITISQALFLVFGLLVGWLVAWPLLAGSALLKAMAWLLLFEVIGVGGFVLVQLFGVGSVSRILDRLGLGLSPGRHGVVGDLDTALAGFYRRAPGRMVLSTGCHFLGWMFSALEAYVILHALGFSVSLATATMIEAFGTGVRFASFMIPGHLGALEGGHVLIFEALGLGAPTGLAFSLVRRVRELAWTAVGFVALLGMRTPARTSAALGMEG
jgi:uncharacterized membrane protein YbhN (UPF0104 family)